MILQDYKIEGDSITITKQELQEACEHYKELSKNFLYSKAFGPAFYYKGKHDILCDILKLFEPIDFV